MKSKVLMCTPTHKAVHDLRPAYLLAIMNHSSSYFVGSFCLEDDSRPTS